MTKLMENIQSSKKMEGNLEKLSLKGYYQSLPERTAPKQQLLDEIQRRCEERTGVRVTLTTVRNWVLYDIKPSKQEYVEVISEITGIAIEDLWPANEGTNVA